jgi:hypothetical protein
MLLPECLLEDRQRAPVERLGLLKAVSGPVEVGQVVAGDCNVRVLGAKSLLSDSQGAPVERLGLIVAAGVLVEFSQVV